MRLLKLSRFTSLFLMYIFFSFALFLYSLTQIDLSLHISRIQSIQQIVLMFQSVGYFQRPMSTNLYITILAGLFFCYYLILQAIAKRLLSRKQFWVMVISIGTILCFSYPAFSYDIFNYLFQARTALVYGKSPYEVTALQFASIDPWVSFMRWTHATSAYSPVWIGISFFPYILGFGYLVLTVMNFKILFFLCYLVCVLSIEKILENTDENNSLYGAAVFAFNPLVIIESIVSSHNDIVMMAACMAGWLFWVKKRNIMSLFFFSLSIGIKTMTFFLFPIIFTPKKAPLFATVLMSIALCVGAWRRELLPWYMLWVIPFVALQPRNKLLILSASFVSVSFLLLYAPFLYFGDYLIRTKLWQHGLFWGVFVIGVCTVSVIRIFFKKEKV